MRRNGLEPGARPGRLLEWDREEGQMSYTVARRGEGWVICVDDQPVLVVKNRRVALHVVRRASELLASAADAEHAPAAPAPTSDEENGP